MREVLGHRKCSLFCVSVHVRFAALNLLLHNGEWAEHTLQIRVVSEKSVRAPVVSTDYPTHSVLSTYSKPRRSSGAASIVTSYARTLTHAGK
jgi:hypothetical protein